MSLPDQVAQAFATDGVLSKAVAGFMARPGQTALARAVAEAIEEGGHLVAEAGTGVGKTFAYLVPALLSGERVLLSTATKALQDQLFNRDLPRLLDALGLSAKVAMLKGRASYVCVHRLGLARQDARLADPALQRRLAHLERWVQSTRSGDLAELPDLEDNAGLLLAVTSSRDNCLGARCPKYQGCHVNQARREALAADVVVINHHLFFADMTVRESGMAELLPSARVVVFDEAHQLNDVGIQFLGVTLGTGQLLALCRDALTAGLRLARGLVSWQVLVGTVEQSSRDLLRLLGKNLASGTRHWDLAAPSGVPPDHWQHVMGQLGGALHSLLLALDTVSEIAPDFVRLHERVVATLERVDKFTGVCSTDAVRWVDAGPSGQQNSVRLVESPLDIAQAFKALRMQAAAASERERSWVFTSATLGHDDALTWFTETCGLAHAQVLRVGSPFNYPAQAALYVPSDFPLPADPIHSAAVAALAARASARLGGRTLVLTTTLKALRIIGDSLAAFWGESGGMEVLIQGQWPKRRLMERFREGRNPGDGRKNGCILVASASFWEGFDVPGDALQLVIIDKLPFPPPDDPLVKARSNRLESQGRNAFNAYFVPEATVALKQGAGRLIRQESDRGVLIVCDPRLATKGYGKAMLAALPPMRRLADEIALTEALDALP